MKHSFYRFCKEKLLVCGIIGFLAMGSLLSSSVFAYQTSNMALIQSDLLQNAERVTKLFENGNISEQEAIRELEKIEQEAKKLKQIDKQEKEKNISVVAKNSSAMETHPVSLSEKATQMAGTSLMRNAIAPNGVWSTFVNGLWWIFRVALFGVILAVVIAVVYCFAYGMEKTEARVRRLGQIIRPAEPEREVRGVPIGAAIHASPQRDAQRNTPPPRNSSIRRNPRPIFASGILHSGEVPPHLA